MKQCSTSTTTMRRWEKKVCIRPIKTPISKAAFHHPITTKQQHAQYLRHSALFRTSCDEMKNNNNHKFPPLKWTRRAFLLHAMTVYRASPSQIVVLCSPSFQTSSGGEFTENSPKTYFAPANKNKVQRGWEGERDEYETEYKKILSSNEKRILF